MSERLVDAHVTLGAGRLRRLMAPELLQMMDSHSVDQAVISAPERCLAVANREGNELIEKACRSHPDRFIGAAGINPWFGAAATDELRRSVDRGLRALVLHPPLQGFTLLDEVADPLLAVAEELATPVYVPTGTPIGSLPLQLAALAHRFPNLMFLMGHMGHSDFWLDAVPAALSVPNILVEVSYKQPRAIREAVTRLGAERVVFGSDAPFNDLGLEVAKLSATHLTTNERALVAGGSVLRALGLEAYNPEPTAGQTP